MQTPDTPPAPADDCVIPILGMHRSGTSMFTRALQLMGVELGKPLMAPQTDNPKGFWENEFFYGVNVRILQAIQRHFSGYGRRDGLLQIPGISAMIERTDEDLSTIEDYIRSQFGASRVWGWKDPRTVLLFPFWLPVVWVTAGVSLRRWHWARMVSTWVPASWLRKKRQYMKM